MRSRRRSFAAQRARSRANAQIHSLQLAAVAAVPMLAACSSGGPTLPPEAGYGPDPQLPPPRKQLIPTVNIAPAEGWPAGAGADARRRA